MACSGGAEAHNQSFSGLSAMLVAEEKAMSCVIDELFFDKGRDELLSLVLGNSTYDLGKIP